MSTAIRARKTVRRVIAAVIITAMLAVAAPAYAQLPSLPGLPPISIPGLPPTTTPGMTATAPTGGTATAITGNGGSVLLAANIALLSCVILVSCGNLGGGNATGGSSGPATATVG